MDFNELYEVLDKIFEVEKNCAQNSMLGFIKETIYQIKNTNNLFEIESLLEEIYPFLSSYHTEKIKNIIEKIKKENEYTR